MKLFKSSRLEEISSAMSVQAGNSKIYCRIKSYSCKMTDDDKAKYKRFKAKHGRNQHDLQASSPGEEEGALCATNISRKTLFYLITTLNATFQPDYDFSAAEMSEFSVEPSLNAVESQLSATTGNRLTSLRQQLWEIVEGEIALKFSHIYSYKPANETYPFRCKCCINTYEYFTQNRKHTWYFTTNTIWTDAADYPAAAGLTTNSWWWKRQKNLKSNMQHTHVSTTLSCRSVRICSYRFVPRDKILLSSLEMRIKVPVLSDPTKTYKLIIPMKYITKLLGNFSKPMPVLFFYVTPIVAGKILKYMKMEDGSDMEDLFKPITLFPDFVCEETKAMIKKIFLTTPYKILKELTPKETKDILIRSFPLEEVYQKSPTEGPVSISDMRLLVIYPPGKGGIKINGKDYLCLAQNQFLNDVIINFYLKYYITHVLASSVQQKVHIFSSFFYKVLTTKPSKLAKELNPYEDDPNLTPAEKRHCRVKNWTKGVNIFEKDYIIIPINRNKHWLLAIICYPGLEGCRSMTDSTNIIAEEFIWHYEDLDIDRDEAEGDESELDESEFEPLKQPCILIFDSLAGASRAPVVATLRDYLTCEHRTKLNSTKTFNKDNIKAACPKVPQQMNYTDCGLYVLQYVESFFKDPIRDYHIPIKMLKNWFEDIVVIKKREDISNLIKELMIDNEKDPSDLPDIKFPTLNGELVDNEEGAAEMGEEIEEKEDPSQCAETLNNSLTQIPTICNSDSSCESPLKTTETNVAVAATSTFVVSNFNSAASKSGLSGTKNKSSRAIISYLKSKRKSGTKIKKQTKIKCKKY